IHRILGISGSGSRQIDLETIIRVYRSVSFARPSNQTFGLDTPGQDRQRPAVVHQLDLGGKPWEARPGFIAVEDPGGDILPVRIGPTTVHGWQRATPAYLERLFLVHQ